MYDLLIKGGRVIDPAQNIDGELDVAISDDKITAVAKDIPSQESRHVVDAKDKIVTPGLIDLHCHVYDGIFRISVEPDVAGVRQSVTTVVDAGSAGQATFDGFPRYVIPLARTTVYCFLNLGSVGEFNPPEIRDLGMIDLDAIAATIEANQNVIKGIKLRLVGSIMASAGIEVIKTAKKAAGTSGLPIMVHIGDYRQEVPLTLTRELLTLMDAGDILTHVFTPMPGGILLSNGTIMPELKEAMERGVVLDIGHGVASFSYDVARKALEEGILPTTVSTDLHIMSLNGPAYGMTATMSKLIALELGLIQVVEMSTINPARALRVEDRKGSLKPGMDADISILELIAGRWKLEEAAKIISVQLVSGRWQPKYGPQETIETTALLVPRACIKSGKLISAEPVAQPKPVD